MKHTVALPWPPKELSPNLKSHWAAKAKAVRRYKEQCHLEALASGLRHVQGGGARVSMCFHPPDNRLRDTDNMIAAFKAGIDAIRDVIGIDDSRWVMSFSRGEPVKGGCVRLEICFDKKPIEGGLCHHHRSPDLMMVRTQNG